MKNYVGRKIRGFRFEDGIDGVGWDRDMRAYIGREGLIISDFNGFANVEFEDDETWYYPISLIEPHLIEENTPEIPQLGEGVLMQVSDNEKDWTEDYIIAKLTNGSFLSRSKLSWKLARPIQQLPKYTHAELVEKLGHDFEIIK
jgi:hypothetical protein